jgi:hypothetical protein
LVIKTLDPDHFENAGSGSGYNESRSGYNESGSATLLKSIGKLASTREADKRFYNNDYNRVIFK